MAHKLPNGVKTHFFQELEKGRILILPKDANQLKEMLELVLYNPSAYTFHYRLREAMVQIQMRSYKYMEQSKKMAFGGVGRQVGREGERGDERGEGEGEEMRLFHH